MNNPDPAHLLGQIAQIKHMERGKLSVMSEGPDGPYFKLQAWENGKNNSRYVSQEQAEAVRKAIEGYQQYKELTEQYAQQIIEQTRAQWAAGSKKNGRRSRHKSSWPKTRKSGSS
jgi:hypothetical protein